jgi:uncharacterized protein YndB with AHSA1/START domain
MTPSNDAELTDAGPTPRGVAMPHAANTVTIDRPIEEVFAYLSDGHNDRHWRSGVVEVERTSPTLGEGTTYRQVVEGPGGRRVPADYRITRYSPPDELAFQVTAGPARPAGRFQLAEAGPGRTAVTFSLDLKPTGLLRLMSPMIAKTMRVEVGQLDRLKARVERQGTR